MAVKLCITANVSPVDQLIVVPTCQSFGRNAIALNFTTCRWSSEEYPYSCGMVAGSSPRDDSKSSACDRFREYVYDAAISHFRLSLFVSCSSKPWYTEWLMFPTRKI